MRDRRREPSGRGELLRVEEHLLEPATLELAEPPDVLHDRDGRDDRAPRVAHLGRLDLHLEAFLALGIGHHDLAPPLAGGLEPERGEERGEPGVVRDGHLGAASAAGLGAEEPLGRGVHRHYLVVVVDHDDRVRYVPQHEVEAVALDPDLFLRGLEALLAARELLADVPDVRDVLQDRDRPAHADAEVRRRRRDDLVDELGALDGVHEGDLAARRRGAALEVPRRERRGEEEVVHPDGAPLPGAVLFACPEEELGTAVLQDDVVVGVGQEDGVPDAVHHPPEPLFLDGVRLAGLAQELDVALPAEGFAGLAREGDERLDVGLRHAPRPREQHDARELAAHLPARGRGAVSIGRVEAFGRAPQRGRHERAEGDLLEPLAHRCRQARLAGRVGHERGHPAA